MDTTGPAALRTTSLFPGKAERAGGRHCGLSPDSHTDRGADLQCLDLEVGENQVISKTAGPSAPLMLSSLTLHSDKGSRAQEGSLHPFLGYVNVCTDSFPKLWEVTHFLGSTMLPPHSHTQNFWETRAQGPIDLRTIWKYLFNYSERIFFSGLVWKWYKMLLEPESLKCSTMLQTLVIQFYTSYRLKKCLTA